MYRLDPNAYQLVRPLFKELRTNLVVDSIIDGNTPAWVYVDRVDSPRTALMWDLQGEMFVAGDASCAATHKALGDLIVTAVLPNARPRGIPSLALFYDTPAWETRLDILLPGLKPEKAARRRYTFTRPKLDWRTVLPAGSEMHLLDRDWLARQDLPNMEHLIGWVDSFWHTRQDFLRASLGAFMLHDGIVASWCLGVFASGKHVELGLATVPEYRKQGYATAAAARCLAFCDQNGLTPHWHCWEDNVASWRIAQKVGFDHPASYTVYQVKLTHNR